MAAQHEGKTFECDICGKKLSDRHKLRVHKELVHEGKQPHSCSICQMTFGQVKSFKKHKQTVVGCSDAIDMFSPKTREKKIPWNLEPKT